MSVLRDVPRPPLPALAAVYPTATISGRPWLMLSDLKLGYLESGGWLPC